MRIVVAGIGSRLNKDGSIGARVAEAISRQLKSEDIEVVIVDSDFAYGLKSVIGFDYVIVLDAVLTGGKPGTVTVTPINEFVYAISRHDMSLVDMLCIAQSPNGCLITIEAYDISSGLELSEELQTEFENICKQVVEIVKEIKDSCTG